MIGINVNNTQHLEVENKGIETLINGIPSDFELIKISETSFKVIGRTSIYEVELIQRTGKSLTLSIDNEKVAVEASDHMDQILEKLGMHAAQSNVIKEIKAPMPGSILDILVEEGASVQPDDKLLVLEAMKMENVIKSPGEGTVSKIHVVAKENVEKNQVLISFE